MARKRARDKRRNSHSRFRPHSLTVALLATGMFSTPLLAAPTDGVIRAGQAAIQTEGSLTRIQQGSDRAVIDWRSFSTAAHESVRFEQPSITSATLNRVTGGQVSVLLGRLDANGQVYLLNPHGVIIGQGAQINVGSFIASTANIDNRDFMAGRLTFTEPGAPGAGIVNAGGITAAEGGLIALVAPRVRNDGILTARLGKIVLAAGDTFTLDLYGDQIINLAMSETHLGRMLDPDGQPLTPHIASSGTIAADGGKIVLVTAATGKTVLDEVINLSGVVRADTVDQQEGRVLLLGQGGTVKVSGRLSAAGHDAGEQGGSIEVLSGRINLAAEARLDASGQAGGGVIHVGGAWQGQGETYRAGETYVAAGAYLSVDALTQGDGGEVVVWADGHTNYSGSITARGGQTAGDGGRVEVSGKQTLDFWGEVDAGALNGRGGSLLLDPAYLNIGLYEAGLINRVLRSGTSTSMQADIDINVNAMIDGRGRYAGGGLTMTAGNDININNHVITYNGTVRLNAGNNIDVAPGYVVYPGTGGLYASSGNTLSNTGLLSAGLLHLTSTGGNVDIDTDIEAGTGNVILVADDDVNINEPVVNLSNGSSLTFTAGNDIKVDAQIDGRGGSAGGSATLTAGNDILLNESIVTNNGAITLTTTAGTVTPDAGKGLFAGTGNIAVTAGGNYATGIYGTTGNLSLRSSGGTLTVATKIDETVGDVSLRGFTGVNIAADIANIRNGSNLTVSADTGDINVNARIDAQDDGGITPVAGGAVVLTAGNDVNINETIVTYNGTVNATATAGTVNFADDSIGSDGSGNKKIITGNAPITITTGGNFTTGTPPPNGVVALAPYGDGTRYLWSDPGHPEGITDAEINQAMADQLKPWVTLSTTGKLTLTSTGGNVTIDAPIPNTTGEIEINAGNGVIVNEHLVNDYAQPITITAGSGGIEVNQARTDDYTMVVNYMDLTDNPASMVRSATGTTVDAGNADLTLLSDGDIDINGQQLATAQTLTLDARGTIHGGGGVERSRYQSAFPQVISLTGDQGIGSIAGNSSFSTGMGNSSITAYSSLGDVNLNVFYPSQLLITADVGSIRTNGPLGTDNVLVAGLDVDVTNSSSAGALDITAGRDVQFEVMDATSIDVTAGRDVTFDATYDFSLTDPMASIWLNGGGLSVTADGNISFLNDSGVSIKAGTATTDPQPALTLAAGDDVELRRLQTYGAVSISAGGSTADGGITLHNDIGPEFTGTTYFTADKGVASLTLTTPETAGHTITMQGARAVGDISITTHTLTAAKSITSSGATNITATSSTVGGGAIGSMPEMTRPPIVLPVISPGPAVSPPLPPAAITALPFGAPGVADAASLTVPAGGGDLLTEIIIQEPDLGEIIPGGGDEAEQGIEPAQVVAAALQAEEDGKESANPLAFDTDTGSFLIFAGGRGDTPGEGRLLR